MESKNAMFNNGDFKLGYYVYEPKREKEEKLPLVVFLHGAGERGDGEGELDKIFNIAIPRMIKEGKKYPAVVLMPQCPSNMVWNDIVFALKNLIDSIVLKYNIDDKKISITGISMGGYGTWEMGMLFPEFFSAMAPVCGGGLSWRCFLLKDTPIWAFHGDQDEVVPITNSLELVDAVNKNDGQAKLTILPKHGHDIWHQVYEQTDIIEWLISNQLKCK